MIRKSIIFFHVVLLLGLASGQVHSHNNQATGPVNSDAMKKIPDNWGSYFANVNDKLASIALNLGLRSYAPMHDKPELLWVWVYLQQPKPNGLSDNSEFQMISAIEDELEKRISVACDAIEAGRITTDGRREFYFYGATDKGFRSAVSNAMGLFKQYRFDLDSQKDGEWNQYLNVLYPSDENLEKMKNQDVLGALMKHGDTLTPVRDVHHWIYFSSLEDREWFASKARDLGYDIEDESEDRTNWPTHPFRLQITRDQSVTPDQIDNAVIELFRVAKQVSADYDGWEAQVIAAKK